MEKELLFSVTKKDLRIDTFYSGGPGGQNQNKRKTGCRITHLASGASGEARDSRSFEDNKKSAFQRMIKTKEFINWIDIECAKYGYSDHKVLLGVNYDKDVIRTYHFPRGLVSDHRTGKKYPLKQFLSGDYYGDK